MPEDHDNPLGDHRLREWADDHPTTVKWIAGALIFGMVTYAILASVTSNLAGISQSSCERGNASRVQERNTFSRDLGTAGSRVTLALSKGEPGEVHIAQSEVDNLEASLEELTTFAASTGFQNAPGGVTISCAEATPPPLPWFGSR